MFAIVFVLVCVAIPSGSIRINVSHSLSVRCVISSRMCCSLNLGMCHRIRIRDRLIICISLSNIIIRRNFIAGIHRRIRIRITGGIRIRMRANMRMRVRIAIMMSARMRNSISIRRSVTIILGNRIRTNITRTITS